MLIDSNIIIAAAKPGNLELVHFLYSISRSVSIITYIESFGFHSLSETAKERPVGNICPLRNVTSYPKDRRAGRYAFDNSRRMGLGDAIIAATAIRSITSTLVTHNTEDFRRIDGLELLDPLEN